MQIHDKVVFITGASAGIGAATARLFAAQGAKVVLAARSTDKLETLVGEIAADGGRALAVTCDVADNSSVVSAFDHAATRFGPVDVLVNNAGVIEPISRLDASDPDDWDNAIDINVKGVYHCARAALSGMLAGDGGVIINISSGAATGALEGWSHYCASKAAVLSLTRCLHKEYADHGVRCVGLSPGTVDTGMQVDIRASGLNPVSQLDPAVHIPAEWVARSIAWLCSPEARCFDGGDFSLKTEEGRALAGLPAISDGR